MVFREGQVIVKELQEEAGDACILVCLLEASHSQGGGSRESEPRNSSIPAAATACSRQLHFQRSSFGGKKSSVLLSGKHLPFHGLLSIISVSDIAQFFVFPTTLHLMNGIAVNLQRYF